MPVPITWVDAFADGPLTGNPAAVCLLEAEAEAGWMQRLATELAISETAFVRGLGDTFSLRWFAPSAEVEICGHATLAAAHVMRAEGWADDGGTVRFTTMSGELSARLDGERIELDFPADPLAPCEALPPVGAPERSVIGTMRSNGFVVLELADEAAVRAMQPDLAAIVELEDSILLVTAPGGDSGADYVLRTFAPRIGIDEDPVTGSAQCALGPLWAERARRDVLTAVQVSQRGGRLWVGVDGDRVHIAGRATSVLRGEVLV
ncbi:MAG TPA: PhzF family phenazine biosynthesis protein [Acidimicrobiales bacterium]|nr:PhzF family phenazine biosynthesis protein [Acidimicrobiales bacterium]